jgi:lysyl oxidase-like protein 2/3/4
MTTPGNQGISVGWADEYVFQLDGQWIDITDVASGSYVLEVETNPTWAIQEKNYLDNSYAVSVTIP